VGYAIELDGGWAWSGKGEGKWRVKTDRWLGENGRVGRERGEGWRDEVRQGTVRRGEAGVVVGLGISCPRVEWEGIGVIGGYWQRVMQGGYGGEGGEGSGI